jgi:hypothetical protein
MVGIVSLQIITINFMFDDVHHWGACAKCGEWKQAIALLQELLEVKNLELDVALRWKFRKLMVLAVLNLGAWCGVPMGTLDIWIFQRRFSNVKIPWFPEDSTVPISAAETRNGDPQKGTRTEHMGTMVWHMPLNRKNIWGLVKTSYYHIQGSNHPLTSYLEGTVSVPNVWLIATWFISWWCWGTIRSCHQRLHQWTGMASGVADSFWSEFSTFDSTFLAELWLNDG